MKEVPRQMRSHNEIEALEKQLAEARKVIEFYGNKDNWIIYCNENENLYVPCMKDLTEGEVARKYLEGNKWDMEMMDKKYLQ